MLTYTSNSLGPDGNHSSNRARIVVVDDSRTQAAMLRQLLQQNGYEVFLASDGRQALKVVEEHQPDLIVADIVMPVMDGYEMCQTLKDDAVTSLTPVILLTALQDPTDIVRGLQVGADYYLTKPYQREYLLTTIESVLARPVSHERTEEALEVEVQGQRYLIRSGRQQMLNLLLSTYGSAVQQNCSLIQAQHELRTLNEKLVAQRQQIEAQQRELREANIHLHNQATRDSLTGLRNRRSLNERFKEEADRARRRGESLSLALLDVDHFKSFNDTFGHPAGDVVLRQVAQIVETHARQSDVVARYGGEEFVLILPTTDASEARVVAERVRHAINTSLWLQRSVTVSIGIATFTKDELISHEQVGEGESAMYRKKKHIEEETNELTLLLARADAALYASKSQGRNRCTHIEDLSADIT